MSNLEQIRKYRLQKSSHSKISLTDSEEKSKELGFKMHEDSEGLDTREKDDRSQYEINAEKFGIMYKNRKYQDFNELTREEFAYSSESSENENKHCSKKLQPRFVVFKIFIPSKLLKCLSFIITFYSILD